MKLSGSKVLVTGADGFIGSHLTESLVREGCSVRALAQYNSFGSWGWLEEVDCKRSIEVVTGDVRDPFLCARLVEGMDVVFHLAALIAIPYSYSAPASYVDVNVKGTLNICQAALRHGVSRLVQTSTSEVYGTAQYVPIDERHPLQPQSPYSASKIAADALAASFYYSFGLPVVIARPFNTYGPRQSARAVIPTIISQIASGRTQLMLGELTTSRDLTFVADTCRGLMDLAACDEAVGHTANIGSNTEITIGDLARLICRIMGAENVEIVQQAERLRPEASEVRRLRCDNAEIRRLTGFQPEVGLEQGLSRTAAWFTAGDHLSGYKPGIYNV